MKTTAIIGVIGALAFGLSQPTAAQFADQMSIHGHFTQAFGVADGGQFLGISDQGVGDYRTAALQFRYQIGDNDAMTVQFSHRSMGRSPITANEQDVQLDWAFYNRRAGDFDVKVGRVPIPQGIYNESRDAGVVLPLFRAPFAFYFEGAFTSETVDGLVGNYRAFAGDWGLELSTFGGSWATTDREVVDDTTVIGIETRVDRGAGVQLWVETPIQGVRFGGGGSLYHRSDEAGSFFGGNWSEARLSLDASLEPVTLQSEFRRFDQNNLVYNTYYVYLGVRPVRRLTLHGQFERSLLDLKGTPLNGEYYKDRVAGLSYAFRPNVVVKSEMHFTDGFFADSPIVDFNGVDLPTPVDYFLFSISTSF